MTYSAPCCVSSLLASSSYSPRLCLSFVKVKWCCLHAAAQLAHFHSLAFGCSIIRAGPLFAQITSL